MSNPFMPAAPAAPAQQPAQGNPYAAQPQYTQQPAQAPNPYAAQAPAYSQPAAPAQGGMMAARGAFATPPPPELNEQGVSRPKVADLTSRLLIVVPRVIERGRINPRFKDDSTGEAKIEDRMTADVIVLDGGPIVWGGQTQGDPRRQENPPYAVKGMWISQRNLIAQCEAAHAAYTRGDGANGLVLGRLWKAGTERNSPYVLAPAAPEDVQLFNHYLDAGNNPYAL